VNFFGTRTFDRQQLIEFWKLCARKRTIFKKRRLKKDRKKRQKRRKEKFKKAEQVRTMKW